ncbi:MAG: hypothetical protein ACRDOD_03745 [Streptosporangiaceae bacterium]
MARFQETLRRLAMIDEGSVEDQAGLGLGLEEIADVLLAAVPVAGLSRVVAAAPEVATALGYGGMLLDVRPGPMPRRRQGVLRAAPSSMSR